MDLEALLHHYFGSADPDDVDEQTLDDGVERMLIDLGKETDPGRKFALWALLHGIDRAPDPAKVFKTPKEREAANLYIAMARNAPDDEG